MDGGAAGPQERTLLKVGPGFRQKTKFSFGMSRQQKMLLATVKPRHKDKTLAVLTLDIGNRRDPEGVNRKQWKTVKAVHGTVYQPLSLVSVLL